MTEKLTLDLLEVLVKHNVIPAAVLTSLRNEKIKLAYRTLRSEGKSGKQAREHLAEINFISEKQIETILYSPKEKKMDLEISNATD